MPNVEAVLLPSKKMRALAERFVVAAIRQTDPLATQLWDEFPTPPIWSGGCCVAVLDSKGETLDLWWIDAKLGVGTKQAATMLQSVVVREIEKSL